MTDAEYQDQKARVERYTERWLIPLGLDAWHVECCWHRDKATEERAGRPPMMETEVRWQYADARVCIYLPSVAEVEDDATLERIVVHEYLHILLNELRPLRDADDPRENALAEERLCHEEHAATMLANAFCRVRAQSRTEGHDAEG